MERTHEFYGWKLVGALWFLDLLNLGFPLYGGSVINTYMLREIQMSRGAFGAAFTLLNFFAGVPSVVIAAAIVRWGVRATFLIGSALLLLGSLWMAFVASQPWHYLLGFGAIVGSGIGFGTIIPLSTAVTRWFKRYRGRANGLAMTASGLAGFIVAPMINRILAANGGNWRQAWMIVSGMAIVGGIIAYLFVKERPEDLGQTADGEVEEAACAFPAQTYSTQYDWTPTEAYKTPAYWLILIASIACQFPFFFVTAHWVLHLKGMGISAADAALAIGIYTGSSVGGRLLGGWLMDTLAAPSVFVLGTCCTILGACLAIVANTSMIAYSAALLMGAGFGWTFVALNTVVGNYYGPEAFPKLMGMLLLLTALVSCSPAGLIGGMLFDRYKSYTPAFSLIIAVCGASIVALYFAKMPQPKKAYLPAD